MIYKAVIFDAGGVLYPELDRYVGNDVKTELGLTDSQAKSFWAYVRETLGKGELSEAQFWQLASKKFSIRPVSPEENLFGRQYAKHQSLRRPIFDVIGDLKQRGVKTAVLSNTIEPHARINFERGTFQPFDEVFLSNELHVRKPGPEMFEVALKQLGVAAEETIFIDDKEVNLEAPRQLGMRGVLFESQDSLVEEVKALCVPVKSDSPWVGLTFLARSDGALLLQHRDNKPTIASPGGITAFGGRGEPGETPLECALRELQEETNLRPKPNDLLFVDHYMLDGEERDFWAFEVKNVDDNSLKVFEGQGFVVLKDKKQADSLPVVELAKEMIKEHSLL